MPPQQDTNSEPSIEEILDSIRQIISDDDEGSTAETVPGQSAAGDDDYIIELTEKIEDGPKAEKPAATLGPQEFAALVEAETQKMDETISETIIKQPEPVPESEPEPVKSKEPEPRVMTSSPPAEETADNLESIITRHAEAAAVKAFSELTQRASIEKGGGITIEDVVRYEVRPLLRAWIDKYLPGIVERLLQKELERISSRFEQD